MSWECKLHQHQWITRMRLSAWIYWKWTKLHRWIRNSKEMRSWMIYFSSFFLFCIYNVFCAPVAKQEQLMAYALDNLCRTKEKNWKIAVWIVGPTRESHETKKLQMSIPLFLIYMCMYDFWIKHKSHFSFFSLFSFLFSFFFLTIWNK